MNRRTFLRCAGPAASILLAGCTEESLEAVESYPPPLERSAFTEERIPLPVMQKADVLEAGVETTADETIHDIETFEAALIANSVPVEHLEQTERLLELEHVVEETETSGSIRPMAVVAGAYAQLVAVEADIYALEGTLLDSDHRAFGEYEILASWADEYNDRTLSPVAYGGKVLDTLKTKP